MGPKRIIIDTDPGVDDALTILLALASPEIQLEALTTTQGNVTVEKATRNALSVLELAHAGQVPVAQGSVRPLVQPMKAADVTTHGQSGLGNAVLPPPEATPVAVHAVDFLINRVLAEPGELTIFAIGPLSNLALAIRKEPQFAQAVKGLVIMGGAIREGGNATALAEFNIYNDPHAAHIVFHSGIPITLIPLDVTHKTLITRADVERINEVDSPVARFVRDVLAVYLQYYEEKTELGGSALHDPLTLGTVISPELLTFQELHVDVDIQGGVSMGNTFADLGGVTKKPANMSVAMDVRGKEFIEVFVQRMIALSRARPGQ